MPCAASELALSSPPAWPVLPGLAPWLMAWQWAQVVQHLQMQGGQRWAQRWQEAAKPERLWAAGGWDLPLASLRWGLQEGEQAWQDAWAALCTLQGEWRQDAVVTAPWAAAWLDQGLSPTWQAWAACASGPPPCWAACMEAARRRERKLATAEDNVP